MSYPKFCGVLRELMERHPNFDLVEFLQEELRIPRFKAEELAIRLQKRYNLDSTNGKEQSPVRRFLEKPNGFEISLGLSVYSVEQLSEKEFELFMEWLLKQLGYEIDTENYIEESGVDFIATKDGKKILILARKNPKPFLLSNSIVSVSMEAMREHNCSRTIIISTTYFSPEASSDAQEAGIELWDRNILDQKIADAQKNEDLKGESSFPAYMGSLLQSLLRLQETKNFTIEPRAGEKYDLYLLGVKFPILTFQAQNGTVIWCVFRIKNYLPIGEFEGEVLIQRDHKNDRLGPDDAHAYALIIQYLDQFLI